MRDQAASGQQLRERVAAQKMSLDAFVERIAAASEGNFLYVVWLLPAIASGAQKFDQPGALPRAFAGSRRGTL